MLMATFAALIAVGTILLRLPVAHGVRTVGLLDALFTATSAVCVTGLTTVDTATGFSRWGQTAILVLIQCGGLGILTFGVVAAEVLRLRVSLTSYAALRDTFVSEQARSRLGSAIRGIILMTAVIELAGAVVLFAALGHAGAGGDRGFSALFHSISAFCNAGFSNYSQNAIAVRDSGPFVLTLMVLITLGGLGYPVLFELTRRVWQTFGRPRDRAVVWTLHSRLVLRTSAILTFGGAGLLLLTGLGDPGLSRGGRLLHSLFQSVTARTAGFNTVDIAAAPLSSLLVLVLLMFVGGSPASCAGGIKTTTAAIWSCRIPGWLRGRHDVSLLGRRVPDEVVRRAGTLVALAGLWNTFGVLLLSISEAARPGVGLEELVFEQISAFGTVGLSTGITPMLSPLGKLWIILTMFVGRVGPLTLALGLFAHHHEPVRYPEERVMIG